MASIKKIKRGSKSKWQARVSHRVDGVLRQRSKSFDTRAEAQSWARKLESKIENQNLDFRRSKISFTSYFEQWYATYKAESLRSNTAAHYTKTFYLIEKFFKDKPLAEITRADFQSFLNFMGKNRAPKTISSYAQIAKQCVRSALLDDVITRDFTIGTKKVADRSKTRQTEYFSIEELKSITSCVEEHLSHRTPASGVLYTVIFTGMRLGEVLGLTKDKINEFDSTILVSATWNERDKKLLSTKTESSKRIIPVPQKLVDFLLSIPTTTDSDFLFANPSTGVPISQATCNMFLHKMMILEGIRKKDFSIHSLRHVHVAYLLASGVDIYSISERLGHKNVSITLETYSYLIQEKRAHEIEKTIGTLNQL